MAVNFDKSLITALCLIILIGLGYAVWAVTILVIFVNIYTTLVIVTAATIISTLLVLSLTTGLWAFRVRNTVAYFHTVCRFLSMYLSYGIIRILLGFLLFFVVYYPVIAYVQPFEYTGPVWSDFFPQALVWVTPFTLYTAILLVLPVLFVLLGTYFQGQHLGQERPLRIFVVNGLTNAIAVSLFESMLVFGFMMTLIYANIVPYNPTNAAEAAGGSFIAYAAYIILIVMQAIFIFLASFLGALWLVWAAMGFRFEDRQGLLLGNDLSEYTGQSSWARFENRILAWTTVDTRKGQIRAVAISMVWQFIFTLLARQGWIVFYYWSYSNYIWIGLLLVTGMFILMAPLLLLTVVQTKRVMHWWYSRGEEDSSFVSYTHL